jgi:hypothetical protein
MWFNQWYRGGLGRQRRSWQRPPRRGHVRLRLEQLEDRMLPSSYTAATVSDLIADINDANRHGGTNDITLTAPTTSPYVLTDVDNKTDGPTGLPVITGGNTPDNLTIVGNGDTIERSGASGIPQIPNFRLFDVANGASLTLQNLTLQNGREFDSSKSGEGGAIYNQGSLLLSGVTVFFNSAVGGEAKGGAIYNQGSLVLSGVTVNSNIAQASGGANAKSANQNGGNGQDAAGGGIWSNGALTLENGTVIQNNAAQGDAGGAAYAGSLNSFGGNGGNASGGGVDIAGGTANVTGGITLSANIAQGGRGGDGFIYNSNYINYGISGNAFGGGLNYLAAASLTLSNATLQNNSAYAGAVPLAVSASATAVALTSLP